MEAGLLKVDGVSSGVQRQEVTLGFSLSAGFMLMRVGRMWLCCGLKCRLAGSPAFSCLTLNFFGKLLLFFFFFSCVRARVCGCL